MLTIKYKIWNYIVKDAAISGFKRMTKSRKRVQVVGLRIGRNRLLLTGRPLETKRMQKGNWIPIDKALVRLLPKGRVFSEPEAAISLTFDYDCGNLVTGAGYASRWGWSRKRVKKFMESMGVEIVYPENTKSKRNQKGHIALHKRNIKGTYKEHKRLVDSKWLEDDGNIKGTYKEHKRNIKGSTTIYPKSLNPNPKEIFPRKF